MASPADVGSIFHQSQGFLDDQDLPEYSIMPLQTATGIPVSDELDTASGMLSVDSRTDVRFAHFPEQSYDLSPTSHLSRFLRALLGDAGTGQLRKRTTIARLQSDLNSTHFIDLDRFYGGIFGATRLASEDLGIDPMADTATSEEWDSISVADSAYRERIIALARSITMGGTVPGLTAAAEAITGVNCEIYEVWAEVDGYGGAFGQAGRTWDDVETDFPLWSDIDGNSWSFVQNSIQVGRSGTNSRAEFVVRVKKDYPSTDEGRLEREADRQTLTRVLSALKPAGTLLTIENEQLALHTKAAIASISSDSYYWEPISRVRPLPSLVGRPLNPYPTSKLVPIGPPTTTSRELPLPPFSKSQGMQITHNTSVVGVNSYTMNDDGDVLDVSNWDRATFPSDGATVEYVPGKGVLDPQTAAIALTSADGSLLAHPYSGARAEVVTI